MRLVQQGALEQLPWLRNEATGMNEEQHVCEKCVWKDWERAVWIATTFTALLILGVMFIAATTPSGGVPQRPVPTQHK